MLSKTALIFLVTFSHIVICIATPIPDPSPKKTRINIHLKPNTIETFEHHTVEQIPVFHNIETVKFVPVVKEVPVIKHIPVPQPIPVPVDRPVILPVPHKELIVLPSETTTTTPTTTVAPVTKPSQKGFILLPRWKEPVSVQVESPVLPNMPKDFDFLPTWEHNRSPLEMPVYNSFHPDQFVEFPKWQKPIPVPVEVPSFEYEAQKQFDSMPQWEKRLEHEDMPFSLTVPEKQFMVLPVWQEPIPDTDEVYF